MSDIMSLITKNANFQGLQENRQERIKALVKSYEDYSIKMTNATFETFEKIKKEQAEKANRGFTWEDLYNVPISMWYSGMKGIMNGLTDLFTGGATMLLQTINNIGEVFKEDGRLGEGKGTEEFFSDLLYVFADPIISIATGLAQGGASALSGLNIISEEAADTFIKGALKEERKTRENVLGNYRLGREPFNTEEILKERRVEEEIIFNIYQTGLQYKKSFGEPFANRMSLGLGERAYDKATQTKVGEFLAGVSESMGRMIPAIASSYLGLPPGMAKAISSTYFFASSFGGAMEEALEREAGLEDAFRYAYGVAAIETLTEQIGGVKFGEKLPAGWNNILSSMFNEALEEAIAEFASAGLETNITGEPLNNEGLWSRVAVSALGGAISGGVFAGAGTAIQKRTTYGKAIDLQNQIIKVYENESKNPQKTQKAFNKSIEGVLNSLNNDSRTDNAFLLEGEKRTPEQRLEAKKRFLDDTTVSLVIDYNEKTGRFELNELGKKISTNIEGFINGEQDGKILEAHLLAISKKKDAGLVHEKNLKFATMEEIELLDDVKKKEVIKNILDKNKNIGFVKGLEGVDGYLAGANGFIYIDMNLATSDIVLKTMVHETTHKIASQNKKVYKKLYTLLSDKKMQEALKKAGIDIMTPEIEAKYRSAYEGQMKDALLMTEAMLRMEIMGEESTKNLSVEDIDKLVKERLETQKKEYIDELIKEEYVAHFVEKMLLNENTLKKVLNLKPELIETLDLAAKKVLQGAENKTLKRAERLFSKYGKQALAYKRGSLTAAIANAKNQTTFIKVGDTVFKVNKNLTGFFNTHLKGNLEANINETHYILDENGNSIERQYSEFSKKEIMKFFELFSVENDLENNIEAIVDNLLLEYDNRIEYREIIGTKFAYFWSLLYYNPNIREKFIPIIQAKKAEVLKEAVKNKELRKVAGIEGLMRVTNAKTFRKIFALNYGLLDSRYAASVSLQDTYTYENEARGMFLFNDGNAGFMVSHNKLKTSEAYRKHLWEKYKAADNAFYDSEFGSFFNISPKKTPDTIKKFIKEKTGVENVIAINEKLVELYKEWGFTVEDFRYDYNSEIMSEWSNSYNNLLIFNSEITGSPLTYVGLKKTRISQEEKFDKVIDASNENELKTLKPLSNFGDIARANSLYFNNYLPKVFLQDGTLYKRSSLVFNSYFSRGFFSTEALKHFYEVNPRQLPVDNFYIRQGYEQEYNKYTIAVNAGKSNAPDYTKWTTEVLVKEAKAKNIIITEEEKAKIKELENKNQLHKILQYNQRHHIGENLDYKPFYYFRESFLREFLDFGTFKNASFQKVPLIVKTEILINDYKVTKKPNSYEYNFDKATKTVQTMSVIFAEMNDKGEITNYNNLEFFPDYIFGRKQVNVNKPEAMNDGGIKKDNNGVFRLEGRNGVNEPQVEVYGIKIVGMPIQEKDLKYKGQNILRDIMAKYKISSNANINMLKINDSTTLVRNPIVNEIDSKTEAKFLNHYMNEAFKNFNKNEYIDSERARKHKYKTIDLKEIAKKQDGAKIVAILKDLQSQYFNIVEKNFKQEEIYNHFFSNFVQQLSIEIAENFDVVFLDKDALVDNMSRLMAETLAYVDNVNIDNEVNKYDANNPMGYQYNEAFHQGLRELMNIADPTSDTYISDLLKKGFLNTYFDVMEEIIKLDTQNNATAKVVRGVVRKFQTETKSRYISSVALDNTVSPTIKETTRQHDAHIEVLKKFMGHNEVVFKGGVKTGVRKVDGLLGDINLFNKSSKWVLDMFGFGNIFGMFMENSTGKVITERIYEGQKKQLEVINAFHDHFDKDNFLKENREKIGKLEKEVVTLNNLIYKNGKNATLTKSQILYLRNVVLREIVRNRLIEQGYREGVPSTHFRDGGFININDTVENRKTKKANQIQVEIKDLIDLFKELDSTINSSPFLLEYNKRVLEFFDLMYDYANIRNKDISGFELANDRQTIERLTQGEKDLLANDLGDKVDISYIYVPMRLTDGGKSEISGVFNINHIIDLGINDGMVMGITGSTAIPLIDSINFVVPQYARSISNYYGLFRIINDLNILFNKRVELSDGSAISLANKIDAISPDIIPYYEDILRDISGYRVASDSVYEEFNKFMGVVKRNFYRATLGLNVKVVATQFASMFTMGITHGDLTGVNHKLFLTKFMKNVLSGANSTEGKYFVDNSRIYKDRARHATYAVGEAMDEGFIKGKYKTIAEATMKGITLSDNLINRAFFITLKEFGYSDAQALDIAERGISRYQSSSLAINKPALLRTRHELLRIFTKFLGEPMKVISNVYESAKQIEIGNKFAENYDKIIQSFADDLAIEIRKQEALEESLKRLAKELKETTNKKTSAELKKQILATEKEITKQKEVVLNQKKTNVAVKEGIDGVIAKRKFAKQVLAQRLTGFVVSVSWQAFLGVVFELLRKGGVKKGKDEDEEVWNFLSKLYLSHLGNEVFGYLPFGRDIYNSIISGYDFDVIGELSSFNRLATSTSNMFNDIIDGGSFNYGKHIRQISLNLGTVFGFPTRQLERFFTTPTNYFLKEANYVYKDITGQRLDSKELQDAIKKGDTRLIETIVTRRLNKKEINLNERTKKEFLRLAKQGQVMNPSAVPDTFTIDGVEYKNDKDKFSTIYENASLVTDRIIAHPNYQKLNDEHKAKLLNAIFTYYHTLAKQEVSGVALYSKERTYTLSQAYKYFMERIPYYLNQQRKKRTS